MGTRQNRRGQQPPVSPPGATAQSSQKALPKKQRPKVKKHDTRWLYKDIDRQNCLRAIAPADLALCDQPVSSEDEARLLGTFCWTTEGTVRVPGREPVFQHAPLPAVLPPLVPTAPKAVEDDVTDTGTASSDKDTTMPPHQLAPLAQAIMAMSPSHSLHDTDIIAPRNSLRRFFSLCAGRIDENFRVGLHLVNDTLVVTKDDRFAWHHAVTATAGVGLSFEKEFTKPLPGTEDNHTNHRVISYSLGDLCCVVQFEADACYYAKQETAGKGKEPAVEEQLRLLSLESAALPAGGAGASTTPSETMLNRIVAPQSAVAEMKTTISRKSKLANALPQLWFGRTPWFIQGRLEGNTVKAVRISKAAENFAGWELKHQQTLRRVVTFVRELRETVRAAGNDGKYCVLVYDRSNQEELAEHQRVVRVYRSNREKELLPEDMIERLWGPA